MEDKILRYLADIENEKEIKILLACETGSRAWGFPSPDNDYDARIIYKRKWRLPMGVPSPPETDLARRRQAPRP